MAGVAVGCVAQALDLAAALTLDSACFCDDVQSSSASCYSDQPESSPNVTASSASPQVQQVYIMGVFPDTAAGSLCFFAVVGSICWLAMAAMTLHCMKPLIIAVAEKYDGGSVRIDEGAASTPRYYNAFLSERDTNNLFPSTNSSPQTLKLSRLLRRLATWIRFSTLTKLPNSSRQKIKLRVGASEVGPSARPCALQLLELQLVHHV